LAIALFLSLTAVTHAQYLTKNVVQPSDPIIASSANSPSSEGVENVIDGTTAKYLNFDMANDAKPAGFIVSPQAGVTWVTGLAIQTANDSANDRDPKEMTVEGSNDDPSTLTNWTSGTWTMIADIQAPNDVTRFDWQYFYFTNYAAYRNYRWTVLHTQGPSTCCMQVAEVQLLGIALPKNVLQPSDPITASSANSPSSEGVENAIDGTTAKYLNFDMANDAKPAGFIVSPQVGATLINGLAIQTANDSANDRDPKEMTVEGSDDDPSTLTNWTAGTWTMIADIHAPNDVTRFDWQTFLFPNFTPYRNYRWTVLHTQGPSTCCMQVAEVQLLGSGAPKNALQPSDPIIASSANSPSSEGVENAIDGTTAKYLNFDMANDAKPAGFIVSPQVGVTVVIGLAMQTANDSANDRDPKEMTVEGSNDDPSTLTNWSSGTWTQIADIQAPNDVTRFDWQYFYFTNTLAYRNYRWTVLHTQGPSTCCMQVAEVELLAVTSQADCTKAMIVSPPVDTPVLPNAKAHFFVTANGPWPLQWSVNGVAAPGGTGSEFTTDPVTSTNATNVYAVAIVGCHTSAPVHAVLFTPSTTTSLGLHFLGSGANGTPTYVPPDTIFGVQQQAYWMDATNATGTAGVGNGSTPDVLNDSSNNPSVITFEYSTSGTWGAGTQDGTPTGDMLNGIVGNAGVSTTDEDMIFHNVPKGTHALLIYAIAPPLNVATVAYSCSNSPVKTYFVRVMNSDEYKAAKGFYRATSTSQAAPSIANFIKFDNVTPDANGDVTMVFDTIVASVNQVGVNDIQLVLNAPNLGASPVITQDPQPTVAPANGVAKLTVTATGTGLTYQWRKNGRNIADVGDISGSTSSTLTISPLTPGDEGVYSVAVFNQAGSTVSANAAVYISAYNIQDALLDYFKFDETAGTNASNAATNGLPAAINSSGSTPLWAAGQIAGALNLEDGATYGLVSNYTKPVQAISAAAWVKLDPNYASAQNTIIRNGEGALTVPSSGNAPPVGQFDFHFMFSSADLALHLEAELQVASTFPTATDPNGITLSAWTHVAFTADGAQLRLYKNGQQVAEKDYTGQLDTPSGAFLAIGAVLNTNATDIIPDPTAPDYFGGQMDELALWGRVLTADEISQLYAAGKAGKALTTIVETPPVVTAPPTLTFSYKAGQITVTWSSGTLQTAPAANGPWTDSTATSPLVEAATGKAQFFRAYVP